MGIIISCEQAQVITPEKLSTRSAKTQSQLNDETSNLQDLGFYFNMDLNHSLEVININPGFEEVRRISKEDCPFFTLYVIELILYMIRIFSLPLEFELYQL